ncbi:hypothetical protein BGZ61DRAFT_474181 [Ilyonectria robusta]|uniref:uncharacterized protein n=1 Tax=Ilyonectria robusta TaxID=1079257 RepID=UPI001E8D9038|nr:uncharacterized protein BGZ61DRAFT_474181 [Ilyonectria robusta]KAH8733503.1 hypothetical protein BGZ61DRAFT_474181 [Ilyonectria robusta]
MFLKMAAAGLGWQNPFNCPEPAPTLLQAFDGLGTLATTAAGSMMSCFGRRGCVECCGAISHHQPPASKPTNHQQVQLRCCKESGTSDEPDASVNASPLWKLKRTTPRWEDGRIGGRLHDDPPPYRRQQAGEPRAKGQVRRSTGGYAREPTAAAGLSRTTMASITTQRRHKHSTAQYGARQSSTAAQRRASGPQWQPAGSVCCGSRRHLVDNGTAPNQGPAPSSGTQIGWLCGGGDPRAS